MLKGSSKYGIIKDLTGLRVKLDHPNSKQEIAMLIETARQSHAWAL